MLAIWVGVGALDDDEPNEKEDDGANLEASQDIEGAVKQKIQTCKPRCAANHLGCPFMNAATKDPTGLNKIQAKIMTMPMAW
jgi:hypothetical protein